MSFLNYIPGVAHAKALTHLVFNDKEGAERTMETFHTKTPIISHLTAGIAKVAGDDEFAKKCWDGGNSSLNALPVVGHVKGIGHYVVGDVKGGNKAMVNATSTTLNMADGIPVVGHAKGIVHYVCGDTEGGNKAMKAATRTTAVMGAGAGGFLIGGPVGAVAVGTTAGAEWDLVVAAATDGKEVNGIAKIIDNPKSVDSYFDAGWSLFRDVIKVGPYVKMAEKAIGNQALQLVYENNKPKSVDHVLVLRQQLTVILRGIRLRMSQDTGSAWRPADRQFQRESFQQVYTSVSELLSNGYSADIWENESLVISSPDGSWREVIEHQVADYLDVHNQLIVIHQEFDPEFFFHCRENSMGWSQR